MLITFLLIAQQAQVTPSPGPSGDWSSTLVSYGVAAPVIAIMLWYQRDQSAHYKAESEKWKEERLELQNELRDSRQAIQDLNDKLLEQQSRLLPLMDQSARAMESLADYLEGFDRPGSAPERQGRGRR